MPATATSARDGPVIRPATPNGTDIVGRSGAGLALAAYSARRPAFGAGGGGASNGAGGKLNNAKRQARLEATVGRLDAALAKAQREAAGAVSTTKYMQVDMMPPLCAWKLYRLV